MLGHKASLNTIKEIKTILSIFSDHNKMKLEINYRKSVKITYMWRLNNMQFKNYWLNEEIKGENLKYLKTNEKKKMICQNLWDAAKAVQRVKYSVTRLSQETRKLPIKQPNPPSKRIRKGSTNKAKVHHKEGTNKDQRGNK